MSTTVIIALSILAVFVFLIVFNYRKMKNTPEVVKSDKILVLNNKSFKNAIRSGLTLVDFWAPWCGPCKMMAPILNDVAEEMDGELRVGKVNVDHNQPVAQKYKVKNIPTLILFKDGIEIDRFIGVKTKKALIKSIRGTE